MLPPGAGELVVEPQVDQPLLRVKHGQLWRTKIFKELNKSLKYRARRSKVLPTDFEDPEGSGEVAVSVADDRELDALQQKGAQGGHQLNTVYQQDPQ